jgi:hypothetical protein
MQKFIPAELKAPAEELQRWFALSFCITVSIGLLIGATYIGTRTGLFPSVTEGIAQAPASSFQPTASAHSGGFVDEDGKQWITVSLPDPPSALADSALVIEIEAIEDAWTEVEIDGARKYAKLLPAGQTLTFQAVDRVRVFTGNAPGLYMRFNGDPVPAARRRVQAFEFKKPESLTPPESRRSTP